MVALIFKKDNDVAGALGVCFLQVDTVDIDEPIDNRYRNHYLVRMEDLEVFLKQCKGRTNRDINISCVLSSFFLHVLTRSF